MILRRSIYLVIVFLLSKTISAEDSIPSFIMTAGKLPQLAYSNGEDRLGSAKMGYIDTLIPMKVLDTVKNLYKVELSDYHYAFIEKTYAQPIPDTLLPIVLCESWRVNGGDEFDSVSFTLNGRVPYKSWMEIDPSRIKIELYNVQSNTNWITQLTSAKA